MLKLNVSQDTFPVKELPVFLYILSGFYGVLKPFDEVISYRLEDIYIK